VGYATAQAWAIRPARPGETGPAELVPHTVELNAPAEDELLVAPVYGCWEGNMGHAIAREPIDVCRARGEEHVVLGNAAAVRVLRSGAAVRGLREGDCAILICNGEEDRYGFPISILGYDCPRSVGCLSKRMIVNQRQLVKVPPDTIHSLAQWAAFSLRYVTAWANWQLAYGVLRLQIAESMLPEPRVCGWGGGVTLAELELAVRQGCHAVMISGRPEQLRARCDERITILDRRQFPALQFDPKRFDSEVVYRDQYRAAEQSFLTWVAEHTNDEGFNVILDYIGEPVHRASLKALARNGVIATAGWKHGMNLRVLRAKECIDRHQHIHTHYANHEQASQAVRFALETGWVPVVDSRVYGFEEIPELAQNYAAGKVGYFPCFAVDPE
jgi:NADPH:quinone reductase-like Zn-dependent oxidoreductase